MKMLGEEARQRREETEQTKEETKRRGEEDRGFRAMIKILVERQNPDSTRAQEHKIQDVEFERRSDGRWSLKPGRRKWTRAVVAD